MSYRVPGVSSIKLVAGSGSTVHISEDMVPLSAGKLLLCRKLLPKSKIVFFTLSNFWFSLSIYINFHVMIVFACDILS